MALNRTDAGQGRHVGVIDTGVDPRHPWMDPERVKAAPSALVTGPPVTSFDGLESWEGHGTFVVGLIRQLVPAATIHVAWPEPEQYPLQPCASCARPRYERALAAGVETDHADDDDMDGGEIDDVAVAEQILGFGRMHLDVLNLSFGGHTLDPHHPPGVVRGPRRRRRPPRAGQGGPVGRAGRDPGGGVGRQLRHVRPRVPGGHRRRHRRRLRHRRPPPRRLQQLRAVGRRLAARPGRPTARS